MSLIGKSGSRNIQTPRKRRERFTDPENHKLVDIILAHTELLFGNDALNARGKAAIWDRVQKEVNKVGGMRRTGDECKKRWWDYKRKVKQIIDHLKIQSSMGGLMSPLADHLSTRQILVAKFYKMNASDGQRIEVLDKSSANIGECAPSNENISCESSTCLPSSSYQDKLISQSNQKSQLQPHTPMDQLVAQQKTIVEVLQGTQKNLTESQNIHKKSYSLLKRSFLELQKTLLSQQKASRDHRRILELRLNSLCAKLDEVNSTFRVKQLRGMISRKESECQGSNVGPPLLQSLDLSTEPSSPWTSSLLRPSNDSMYSISNSLSWPHSSSD